MSSNCIREKLLENAELSLDRAYGIARSLYAAQKNSELYLQQSHRVIPTNVAATSTDHQTEPDHEALATMKKKMLAKSLATSVEDSYILAVHLALPVMLYLTIALNEDILLKYVNLQRRLQLLVLLVSLHYVPLQLLAPLVSDMLPYQSQSMALLV